MSTERLLQRATWARVHWRDYWVLCKPRVVALMILTALVGMCLATPTWIPLHVLLFGNLGIALAAASAATLNHLVDRHLDQRMRRTERRPMPQGRVTPRQALCFSGSLCVTAMVILGVWINVLTAALTFASIVGYAGIYSLYLKHATPQNIVIGGVAGAAPPLLGWVAVTGHIDPQGLLLMLIIFVWTPPHFWALAIHRYEDYRDAQVPMLPNTHGIPFTALTSLLYTLLLTLCTTLPFVIGMSGWLYWLGALALNARFLYLTLQLYRHPEKTHAWRVFKYSIYYLMLLFLCLLVDHYVTPFF